MTEYT